jgi:O-antigen ligase
MMGMHFLNRTGLFQTRAVLSFVLAVVLFVFIWLRPEIGNSHKYNQMGTILILLSFFILKAYHQFSFRQVFYANLSSPSFWVLVLILCGGLLLSIFVNYSQSRSYTRWFLYISLLLLFLTLVYLRSINALQTNSADVFLGAFVWLKWMLLVLALIMVDGFNFSPYFKGELLAPYFSNIRAFGKLNWLIGFSSLYLMLTHKKMALKFLGAATFALSVMAIVGSGSRGALVSTLVLLIFLYLLKARGSIKNLLYILLFVFLSLQFFSEIFSTLLPDREIGSISQFLLKSSGRIDMWRESLEAGMHHFWLGVGPEAFKNNPHIPTWGHYTNPHNGFLQIFLEFGFLGLCLVLFSAIKLGKTILSVENWKSKRKVIWMSFVMSWMTYFLIDGVAYHVFPLLFFVVVLAYLTAESNVAGEAA